MHLYFQPDQLLKSPTIIMFIFNNYFDYGLRSVFLVSLIDSKRYQVAIIQTEIDVFVA